MDAEPPPTDPAAPSGSIVPLVTKFLERSPSRPLSPTCGLPMVMVDVNVRASGIAGSASAARKTPASTGRGRAPRVGLGVRRFCRRSSRMLRSSRGPVACTGFRLLADLRTSQGCDPPRARSTGHAKDMSVGRLTLGLFCADTAGSATLPPSRPALSLLVASVCPFRELLLPAHAID